MKLTGATIPDSVVQRVVARRGAEHCFAALIRRGRRWS